MHPSTLSYLILFLLSTVSAFAITDAELADMTFLDDEVYVIRLENGDILSGPIVETAEDSSGAYVRVMAVIGRAKVYAKEIAWISTSDDSYRHRHRGYIMPTAQPIRNDHFVALIEGIMPYLGFGIGEWFSMTGGRTLIPGIDWSEQISVLDAKITVHSAPNGLVPGGEQYYALGFNGGWLNDVNFMGHVYGVATFTGMRTQASVMMFAKVAGADTYTLTAGDLIDPISFALANGTFGVGLSLDTRFPEMRNLHFIGELWNADLTRPSNTALYVGLRLTSTAVAMDFGFTTVPGPAFVPTVAFAWTPF
ncbi:MAG: hypothetical protein EHM43_11570 [Ignavibacteriae bacterium]|nr:MAG: hypothetical protein EHM43_11570 [Ignavibacteriota bacterium]